MYVVLLVRTCRPMFVPGAGVYVVRTGTEYFVLYLYGVCTTTDPRLQVLVRWYAGTYSIQLLYWYKYRSQ